VATNIAGTTPWIGAWLQRLLQGGSEYGSLTLTRFYALHVGVLPAATAALFAVHLTLFRKHGVTPPASATVRVDHFYPRQLAMDLAAALAVVGVTFALALRAHGAPLDGPAEPASDYPARPEWYFLPLFQLLKYLHGALEPVGAFGVPALAALYLVLLPLVDRKASSALRPRLTLLAPLLGGLGATALLGALALHADAHDATLALARAKADKRAAVAIELGMQGVPPEGPLAMLARDPELRGEAIFAERCAPCHVLGDLGDPAKATAATLDGWGTAAWVRSVLHDPDAPNRFGRTPYKGIMPSFDTPPKDARLNGQPFKATSEADLQAVATFLAAQADPKSGGDPDVLKRGEDVATNRCTTCHVWKGDGDIAGDGDAPELAQYGSLAWLRAQITNPATPVTYRSGLVDEKGHMPAFAGELTPADVDVVARWVWAKARARDR
jgi:ubiquinol-cytochrome c reductase cytochrome b subunit